MKRGIFVQLAQGYCLSFTKIVAGFVMWLAPFQLALGQESSKSNTDRNFSLLEGRGVPVCDAYLELLNKSKFEISPFCGRPHEGSVNGFQHVEGYFMTLEEAQPLFTKVWEFMRFGDQNHIERFFYPNATSPKLAHWSTEATDQHTLARDLKSHWTSVWAFAAPIDINNDGVPLEVIIWQGHGATGTGSRCGSDNAFGPWESSYVNQRAFVLTFDGKSIDESQTRLIFGASPREAQSADPQLPGGSVKSGPGAFRPLADSIGVFKFENSYYIESENRPQDKYGVPAPVHVLLRERGSIRNVCTLNPEAVPIPKN